MSRFQIRSKVLSTYGLGSATFRYCFVPFAELMWGLTIVGIDAGVAYQHAFSQCLMYISRHMVVCGVKNYLYVLNVNRKGKQFFEIVEVQHNPIHSRYIPDRIRTHRGTFAPFLSIVLGTSDKRSEIVIDRVTVPRDMQHSTLEMASGNINTERFPNTPLKSFAPISEHITTVCFFAVKMW